MSITPDPIPPKRSEKIVVFAFIDLPVEVMWITRKGKVVSKQTIVHEDEK